MRSASNELHEDAVAALVEALRDAGLRASPATAGDLALEGPGGTILIDVKAVSVLDSERAQAQVDAYSQTPQNATHEPSAMVVIVADQLSEGARELLRQSELGYLDRRGALWLRRPDLIVNDTSLPPLERHRARSNDPIRGRVALGVALRRLMHPDVQESVRQIAGAIGASASTVHDALTRLREHALIEADGASLIPDLFEAVAAVWRPQRIPVGREPQPNDSGTVPSPEEDQREDRVHGWVVAGDVGAAAAGAPIVITSGAPPDLYLPTQATLRGAIRQFGQSSYDQRTGTVALAPSPAVTDLRDRFSSPQTRWSQWPIAHPVVIALDLAQDLARGHEIINDWSPQGFHRVW